MPLSVDGTNCGNNEKYCTKLQGNYSPIFNHFNVNPKLKNCASSRWSTCPHTAISRRDTMFSAFRMARQQAITDCVTSIQYYSELINHMSKNGKSLHDENIPITWLFRYEL